MKRITTILLCCIVLLSCCITDVYADFSSSRITVYFLDVNQGDAAVVVCDDHAMMIDGGGVDQSDYIYSFLQKHGIDHLDYVVATHPATDHIGGLSAALNYATADNVFCNYTDYDLPAFSNLKKYTEAQGLTINKPAIGAEFSLGPATVTVLGPYYSENNSSIVLKVEYGNISFLFTGDTEANEEYALLQHGADLKSTVLKVGHHGSSTSTTQEFLDAVSPDLAVISVGGDNTYGHPDTVVLDRLYYAGTEVYRTDMHGIITISSDGHSIQIETEKEGLLPAAAVAGGYDNFIARLIARQSRTTENDNSAGKEIQRDTYPDTVPTGSEENTEPESSYIVNTNTGKFHYPYCSSVNQMKESNKWCYTGTRSSLINQGYSPCGRCNP